MPRFLPSLIAALLTLGSTSLVNAQTTTRTIAQGLAHPWALAFLPDGNFLVTERKGSLRVVEPGGRIRAPVQGVPVVQARGQGGLLDLALDRDFTNNRTLYLCYAEPSADSRTAGTALARARLSEDATRLEALRVIFQQHPKVSGGNHFGCRIAEVPDGTLFLAMGERYGERDQAQTLDNHLGKVVRIHKDGSVPPDNPFVSRAGTRPEIWSYGHRNPQGLAFSPRGALWLHEHGPMGGDEINRPAAGANFGWPLVSHGRNYNDTSVGTGERAHPGTAQPLHTWVPSIAPSGMAFVTSERYGKDWVGNLLVGSLKYKRLVRLELAQPYDGPVQRETRLLPDLGERVRDVRQGPDGYIYLLTDHPEGRLLRLDP
ncbi:MAG: PQQ-dependent sugar dehydrogenase [Hylemonella sp.]|uniref:PQQ-dependent sugar dehydrogenase n=1 Tax=Hylemonella sp. TaxID=2066020 RepID=UPI0022C49EFC|nr:PQQ-dependent sugar dehydrogenase [Hylemonella sp.]MCZ8251761.1 PQQ-dependent sugar dehydrogenase [Hylemonella sp.]